MTTCPTVEWAPPGARMWRLSSVVALSVVACGSESPAAKPAGVTTPSAAVVASSAAAVVSPPSAPSINASVSTPPPASSSAPAVGVRCLDKNEIDSNLPVQWKLNNPLSVVKVSPDDSLNVRAQPGVGAGVVGALAHDARDVAALGKACRVGTSSIWLNIKAGEVEGWVNAGFLIPTTTPQDKTAEYIAALGDSPRPVSQWVARLSASKQAARPDPEVPFRVKLIGKQRTKHGMVAVIHQCCYADDALSGEQLWLEFGGAEPNLKLVKATEVSLCHRGAVGPRCK